MLRGITFWNILALMEWREKFYGWMMLRISDSLNLFCEIVLQLQEHQ